MTTLKLYYGMGTSLARCVDQRPLAVRLGLAGPGLSPGRGPLPHIFPFLSASTFLSFLHHVYQIKLKKAKKLNIQKDQAM